MNKLRKLITPCLLLLLLVTLCGCRLIRYTYSFAQDFENVDSIQICKYSYDEKSVTPLKQLSKEEQKQIFSDISALPNYHHFGDHTEDYGNYVVFITYTDGTAEVIGESNVAIVTKSGEWRIGIDYFDFEEFQKMIAKYYRA